MRRPQITLTIEELHRAIAVGVQRNVSAMQRNASPSHNRDKARPAWDENIEGAAGELAVAKYFGCRWDGNFGNFKAADVHNIEVRTTAWPNGKLIVHPSDPDDRRFILATGIAPRFTLVGWMTGRQAKQKRWWGELTKGRPAFNVPQAELKELPARHPT